MPGFPPDKPDERNLLDTGVRTLVGLGHGDIVEEIRSDYVGKVWQGLEANDLQDFSLGLRYYVVYNNLMALILHGLLQRTAEERDKWRRRQLTGTYAVIVSLVYAPVRFALDFLRIESADVRYAGLTPAQWLCIPLFLFGLVLLRHVVVLRRRGIDPSDAVLAETV